MSDSSGGKFRSLPPPWDLFSKFLLLLLTLSGLAWAGGLPTLLGLQIYEGQFVGYMAALLFCLIFLLVPPTRKASRSQLPWYDLIFALLSLGFCGYYAIAFERLILRPTGPNLLNIALGCIAILLILESIRRFLDVSLVVTFGLTVIFAVFGADLHLHSMKLPWHEWIYMLYVDQEGIFGTVLKLLSTYVLCFFIFGTLLTRMGGGEALIKFSLAVLGRFSGGPGKAAIIASGLFGTITGSSIIEAGVIGPVTIPMMKRAGFRPEFAAGLEAAAATGGCIMPPVMGLVAFLIAEFLSIPYYEVAIAAFVPACFYYWILFVQVHLQAKSSGLRGLPRDMLPPLKESIIGLLPFLMPPFIIIYTLIVLHWNLPLISFSAVISTLIASLFRKDGYRQLRNLPSILMEAGRSSLDLAAIGGGANLFVGGIMLSSISVTFTSLLVNLSGGSVLVLLALAGIGSLILGMPLPSFVTYVIVAVLFGPAFAKSGILLLAGHLFLMYYGATAPITPPSCVAVFITRSIADADFWGSAWSAMRLSIGAYVIPWVFLFDKGLLLMGSPIGIIYAFFRTFIGVTAVAIAFEGYLKVRLKGWHRLVLFIGSAGVLAPYWIANLIGAGVLASVLLTIKVHRME